MPTGQARYRDELVRSPRTPKRKRRVLPVENPTQCKMDDPPSIVCLRETIEPFNCLQVLRKPRSLELRVVLSQVIPGKLRLPRHAAGEQTPTMILEAGKLVTIGPTKEMLRDR